MNEKVTFYCESCQKQVNHRAKICPHCGSFFSLVKCPVCERRGPGHEFLHGCPSCGYLGDGTGSKKMNTKTGELETLFVITKDLDHELPRVRHAQRSRPSPPPVGTILSSIAVLGFLVTVLSIWLSQG